MERFEVSRLGGSLTANLERPETASMAKTDVRVCFRFRAAVTAQFIWPATVWSVLRETNSVERVSQMERVYLKRKALGRKKIVLLTAIVVSPTPRRVRMFVVGATFYGLGDVDCKPRHG